MVIYRFKKIFVLVTLMLSSSFFINAVMPSTILDIRGKDILWVSGNTNNIRVIETSGGKKYFKECKTKVPVDFEVKRIINIYFNEYLNKPNLSDKNLISECLSNKQNINKFVNMGRSFQPASGLTKYLGETVSSAYLGIPVDIASNLQIDLSDFFLFASRELTHRNISKNLREGMLQTDLAMKQLGTYRFAQYLGLDSIVAKTDFVRVFTDYGEKLGIIVDEAIGIDILNHDISNFSISPSLQRELTTMQIFDTLVYEQDHFKFDNYRFKIDNNEIVGVISFDNEACFGSEVDLKKGLAFGKLSSTVTSDGKINFPHMDKMIAYKILNINDDDIDNVFEGILLVEQIKNTKSRIRSLQSAIIETIKTNENFLISDNMWSEKTMREEINGNCGDTYFNHFYKNNSQLNISVY